MITLCLIDIIDATGRDSIMLANIFSNARIQSVNPDLAILANQPSTVSSRIKTTTATATEFVNSSPAVDMIVIFPDLEQDLTVDGVGIAAVINAWINKTKLLIVHIPVFQDISQIDSKLASNVGRDKVLWEIPSKDADYKLAIFRPKQAGRRSIPREVKTCFPQRVIEACPDYKLLRVLPESLYSSLLPGQITTVSQIFKTISPVKTIIDANAHIGCDTINLSRIFPEAEITAIDSNPEAVDCLSHNVKALGLTNIKVAKADAVEYLSKMSEREVDLVYFDPPWGGRDYKSSSNLMLYLSGKPIWDIVNSIKAGTVVLKAPTNFDINTFRSKIKATMKVEPVYDNNKLVYNLILIKF